MKTNREVEAVVRELGNQRLFLIRLLKDLHSAKIGNGWDAVTLARIFETAENSPSLKVDLISLIASARASVEPEVSRRILELEADIRDLCHHRGWRVDGQWPKFYIERATELAVSKPQNGISIAGTKLKGLSMKEIEKELEGQVKGLIPRGFEAGEFLTLLSRAYDSVCGGRGGEVSLLRVYRELVIISQPKRFWRNAQAKRFAELTIDQFRARFSAALETGATSSLDGRELRLLPPIDPKDAVFLHQPAERRFGFVGRIEFRSASGVTE